MLLHVGLRNARFQAYKTLHSGHPNRQLSSTIFRQQHQPASANLHRAYYQTHGRALFKSLTLAFLSYQIFYWIWLTLETETMKDEKSSTIQSLQNEVKMLSSGKGTHVLDGEKKLLDEKTDR